MILKLLLIIFLNIVIFYIVFIIAKHSNIILLNITKKLKNIHYKNFIAVLIIFLFIVLVNFLVFM
jgi:hypothetical protein